MLASLPVAILNHDSRQMGIPHDSKQDDNALALSLPIPAAQFDALIAACGALDGATRADELIGLTVIPA